MCVYTRDVLWLQVAINRRDDFLRGEIRGGSRMKNLFSD